MAYSAWSVVYGEQPSAAKWNILGTNDAHFYDFLGDNTAWQSWTPTLTNLSGGTIGYAKYTLIGKTVHYRFKYTLAGAGVAGEVSLTAPVSFHADYATVAADPIGIAVMQDVGSALWSGVCLWTTGGKILVRVNGSAATYTNPTALSPTVPHTWASPDTILISGSYEAA